MRITAKCGIFIMSEKTTGNGSETTTLNLSVTVQDKRFLKVYASQNGTTISGMLQDYIETLKHSQDDGTKNV
jgi:hypothetical protein